MATLKAPTDRKKDAHKPEHAEENMVLGIC